MVNIINKKNINAPLLNVYGTNEPQKFNAKCLGMTLNARLRIHVKIVLTDLRLKYKKIVVADRKKLAKYTKVLIYCPILKPIWMYDIQL